MDIIDEIQNKCLWFKDSTINSNYILTNKIIQQQMHIT